MAERELMDAVDELLDRNTNGMSTISALARKMSELEPRKNAESWRKELRRWRTGTYKEMDVSVVARAFNIRRTELPAAKARTTVAELDRRLAELEATVGLVEEGATVGNLLEELATKLGDVAARLRDLEAESGSGAVAPTDFR